MDTPLYRTDIHDRVRGACARGGARCTLPCHDCVRQTNMRDARAWRVVAACALVLACGMVQAQPASSCERQVLQELGWRFVASTTATATIDAGTPCDRGSLAEAHVAGDLRVHVPVKVDAGAMAALERGLLEHPGTHCAFAFALGAATRRAVDRLVANRGFRFSTLQPGWIDFGITGAARDGWRPVASFGRAFRPRGGNSDAIEGFYRGRVRAECGVGRQVAQYAAQAELYGAAGFDAAFAADEIVIGTFHQLNRSRSILQGSSAGSYVHDGLARQASAQGRQAFMGVPGFIEHVFDKGSLDDLHNQAENFVVYDLGADAAAALRRRGGFARYNEDNRELWALARTLPTFGRRRYFQRLLHEREPQLHAELPTEHRAIVARMDALLADPFYRDFRIYVHKLGVQPVGYHIVRLLDRNPRTPYRIGLALHNVPTTLQARYVAHRLSTCLQGAPPRDTR